MEESIATRLTTGLLRLMMFVVWAIWAPIGFLLWIPLLVRTTIVFAGFVVHAAITGQDPTHLRQHLEAAIDFWFAGFRFARETVAPEGQEVRRPFQSQTSRVLLEVVWAAAFWGAAILVLHPETITSRLPELPTTGQGGPQEVLLIALVTAIIAFVIGVAVGNARKEAADNGKK
jgi:small-conductance mechanosensitive channel